MFALFPSMNYKPWVALGEMVDNSIQSYLVHKDEIERIHGPEFRLMVEIEFAKVGNGEITVSDNAAGISSSDVERAFTPAVPPPDKTKISQHGIGMKSSSAWYANNFQITSKALGETVERTVAFDVPEIIRENLDELPIKEVTGCPAEAHYTKITLSNLHQPLPEGRTLGKIRSYISSIYRDFLRNGDAIIRIGGIPIEFANPVILSAPYWPNDKGPSSRSATRNWIMPVEIKLEDSWKLDTAPGKPVSPPTLRGWFAILKEGSTSKSGAALMWRQKVVVGAGSLADGNEDTYRPQGIFGASTTFPFQRLFGELDISELQVTTFKDQVDWRNGQEEELESKLRDLLRSGDEPILRMANNYRSTLKTVDARAQVQESAKQTVESTTLTLEQLTSIPEDQTDARGGSLVQDGEITRQLVPLPEGFEGSISFEVSEQKAPTEWLEVISDAKGQFVIRINRDHLFMKSFVNLPGADLDPVFRLAFALGVAEINAQLAGIDHPRFIRKRINEYLNQGLASRTDK